MKTKIFTLVTAALLLSSISFAKLFRIGYVGPLVAGVDFPDGQSAHDAASNGDTLQFYPSLNGNYNFTCNKRLVMIGNGYLLSGGSIPNTGLNMITGSTGINVAITPSSTGSDGTIIEGFDNVSVQLQDKVTLSNFTITRCNTAAFQYGNTGTISLTNCKITECFLVTIDPRGDGGSNLNITLNNYRVENCVIQPGYSYPSPFYSPLNSASTVLINNCLFRDASPDFSSTNVVVQNCIFYSSVGEASNTVFNNNIFGDYPTVSGANNQFGVNNQNAGANVFVGVPTQGTYSDDAKYQLTSSSPAKGAGIGGIDLGIYGGANPYHLSGIAPIPAIYKLQAATPNATTNPYPITVSVRSNN